MLAHAARSFEEAATERSSVTLGDSLDFVFFTHCEGIGSWALGSVDDLISKALSNGLHVSESRFAGSLAEKVNSLVNSAEWGNIDGLSADNTT